MLVVHAILPAASELAVAVTLGFTKKPFDHFGRRGVLPAILTVVADAAAGFTMDYDIEGNFLGVEVLNSVV